MRIPHFTSLFVLSAFHIFFEELVKLNGVSYTYKHEIEKRYWKKACSQVAHSLLT